MPAQAALFQDRGKVNELLETIRKCGERKKGMREFAQKNGVSFGTVNLYFYKKILTPELDRELPYKSAAKPQAAVVPSKSVEQALWELLKKRVETPLKKEDIEAISRETGEHYHTVLSTWGNMAKDVTQIKIYETAASSVMAEEKLVPSDFDKAIEATGLNPNKVESAIFNLLHRPEYRLWREQMCILKREARLSSSEKPAIPTATTSVEEAMNTVSLEHLCELYQLVELQAQKIDELKSTLQSSRKVNLSLMKQWKAV